MKTTLQFFAIIFCAILFLGCSKNGDAPISAEQKVVNFLTGTGNRYWKMNKVFVNGVEQALTSDQKKYTKTYTISLTQAFVGSFTNSDGYVGKWLLSGPSNLIETINNNQQGPVQVPYIINEIGETQLDIEYTLNFKTIREVYYAH